MNCLDLYSGIGGWTLGMKLNGIEHIQSYEWNRDSNYTHNMNFGTTTGEVDIRKLDLKILPKPGSVDFVVGSPPCTQFSYSNKGGSGNVQDGLVDMYQFLKVVKYLKPRYWAMENIPRVKSILEMVLDQDAKFKKFKNMFNYIEVVDCSEYGLPQKRKRMIAGKFPFELFEAYKLQTRPKTLGDVLASVKKRKIVDPIFGYVLSKNELTDHIVEDSLNDEELRINRESKRYHPVYNLMSFPEKLNRPSRTITSTCTRVSRESSVIKNGSGFRRLTVRERGMLMGFPITYQFYGSTYESKLKMIGNAIPPVVTYYLFQSMLELRPEELTLIGDEKEYTHNIPSEPIPVTPPSKVKFKYRDNRSFRFAIPEYRFGSGVRFELSNKSEKTLCDWSVKFFYGSSTNILEVKFDEDKFNSCCMALKKRKIIVNKELALVSAFASNVSASMLQKRWCHKHTDGLHPYEVLDKISVLGLKLKTRMEEIDMTDELFTCLVGEQLNRKLYDNKALIMSGIMLGHVFNKNILK